jgi:hypothetical protein
MAPPSIELLPVLVLSENLGDSGMELLATGATLTKIDTFSFKAPKALVYLDVDSFDRESKANIDALALARELGWSVVVDSMSWNSSEVAKLTGELFPEAEHKALGNTTVIVEHLDGAWRARDTYTSEVAVKAGVRHELTSEGKAIAAKSSEKARASESFLAHFANQVYQANPPSPYVDPWIGGSFTLAINKDVVKVWRRFESTGAPFPNHSRSFCVVAWRGTTFTWWNPLTWGDWLRNIENQFAFEVQPWSVSADSRVRVGRGYQDRFVNQRDVVASVITNCDSVAVTGHSLGGGMAQLHAFTLRAQVNRFNGPTLARLEAYNPARVGNRDFVTVFRAAAAGSVGGKIRVFCRFNDPVDRVPIGLWNAGTRADGCDTRAPAISLNASATQNHAMTNWL